MRQWLRAVFGAGPCLVSRLTRRAGGIPQSLVVSFLIVGLGGSGQPGAGACRRLMAAVIWVAQRHRLTMRSLVRRPPRMMRPATASSRSRMRLGSQRRAGLSRVSIVVQASSSLARATSSHHGLHVSLLLGASTVLATAFLTLRYVRSGPARLDG